MPTSTKEKKAETVLFGSRADNHAISRFSPVVDHFADGRQHKKAPGLVYQFDNHMLAVTDELRARDQRYLEQYGHHYPPEKPEATFETPLLERFYSTDEYLRRNSAMGFIHEIPKAIPPSGPTLQAIADALIDGDEDRVAEILLEEQEGAKRADVLDTATRALATFERGDGPYDPDKEPLRAGDAGEEPPAE